MTLLLVGTSFAGATATPFDRLFPSVRVITRAGDFRAGEAYGAYQYRLPPSTTFDVSYRLRLSTAQQLARVRTVTFSVLPQGPEVSALKAAPRRITAQLFATVAQQCFGMRSARVPALQAWVQRTATSGDMASGSAQFGPVKLAFERTQSSGAGYYDLSYTFGRDGSPGSAPWAAYCTFF